MKTSNKPAALRTYSQNLRLRRNGLFGSAGEPIPGTRSEATLARKARSKASRAARKQRAAEAVAAKAQARNAQGATL